MAKREPDQLIHTLGALSRCLRTVAAQAYAAFDVGNTQAKFLRHIGAQERISQIELARATGTDPALTGRVLETLVERGWVRRKRSDTDRRQYVLELSAAGERLRHKVEAVREQLARQVTSALTERDLDDFERVAKKVLAAFDEPPQRSE